MDYKIEKLQNNDKKAVARLHMDGIPIGFLSSLGEAFLAELYMLTSCAPKSDVWIAKRSDGEVLGFIAGTADIKACYRYIFSTGWHRLAFAMLPHLWKPAVIKRAMETVFYPDKEKTDVYQPKAELLAIAVSEKARGMGVGKNLIATLEKAFCEWGLTGEYKVVTYSEDPGSNAFYQKTGFWLSYKFQHHDHIMNEYRKVLPNAG